MKRRNKWVSLVLTIAMVMMVALTGCGGNSSSASNNSASSDSTSDNTASNGEAQYQMRIAYSYAPTTQHGRNMIFFEEKVEELTDGRVDVVLFPNNQICALNEELNMVKSGAVEAAYTINGIAETVNPLEGILVAPFIGCAAPGEVGILQKMQEDEQVGGIIKKWAEDAGFHSFGVVYTNFGTPVCSNDTRPIVAPGDAKGLKLRHFGGEMLTVYFDAIGANGVTIAGSEVPVALQQGIVNGAPSGMLFMYESQWMSPYLTLPFALTGTEPFYCNLDWWNSLPADIQEIIDGVIPMLQEYSNESVSQLELDAIADMETWDNFEINTWDLTDPEIAAFAEECMMDGLNYFVETYGEDAEIVANRIIELREEYLAAQ